MWLFGNSLNSASSPVHGVSSRSAESRRWEEALPKEHNRMWTEKINFWYRQQNSTNRLATVCRHQVMLFFGIKKCPTTPTYLSILGKFRTSLYCFLLIDEPTCQNVRCCKHKIDFYRCKRKVGSKIVFRWKLSINLASDHSGSFPDFIFQKLKSLFFRPQAVMLALLHLLLSAEVQKRKTHLGGTAIIVMIEKCPHQISK